MSQNHAPWAGNSDDEDDPDTRESWMWGGKRAFIFLIDATEKMFKDDFNDSSPFMMCIQACKEIMLKAALNQGKDLYGIVAYGTKHVGQGSQANHITTVQDLDTCSADKIKELINIEEDVSGFEKKHGHSYKFSLADALWHCTRMVSNSHTKLYERTILLLTCDDDPHSADPKLQHDTRTRASDLNKLDIKLEILPVGISFNFNLFFKELHEITHDLDDQNISDKGIILYKTVEDIVNFLEQSNSKRSVSRVLWSLGEGVKLGIAAYSFVRSNPPFPKKVKVDRTNNTSVTSRIQNFSVDTGEEVSAAETSKALKVGGQTVIFQTEELIKVKQLTTPGLVLLGFKPTFTLKPWFHKRAPLFAYPEERIVKGSRTLFAALHEECLKLKKAPICYFTPRRSAKPSLVALVPLAERLNKKNVQLVPPGFAIQFLPYADNIRDLKEQEVNCNHPDEELVSVAESVIDKMKFPYKPSIIDNPKLQKHLAGIEALALGSETLREVGDLTVPDYEMIDERLGDLACQFMNMAFPDGFDEAMAKKSVKRTTSAKPPAPKKVKPDFDVMSMEDIANQGLVEKLTVDKLKQYLLQEDIKVGKMKKAELVEAVYHHLGVSQP